jgi:hypothetical protein
MKREGKVIEGFPNYLIYPDGSVFSKKRNKFMKQKLDGKKHYYQVTLYKDGKHTTHSVHRLVALAHLPNHENKTCIDHINRIKTDNRLENLRWTTHSENKANVDIYSNNKIAIKNIIETEYNTYQIHIRRYKLRYSKNCKTLEEAIIQRDLMLSMWP